MKIKLKFPIKLFPLMMENMDQLACVLYVDKAVSIKLYAKTLRWLPRQKCPWSCPSLSG